MTSHAPEGWPTITPRIVGADPSGLVEFLSVVFGATANVQPDQPSIVQLGDSKLMVSASDERDATSAFLYVYVKDADDAFRRAMNAGAVSLETPATMHYGDRRCMVRDPWGNTWQIAHVPS